MIFCGAYALMLLKNIFYRVIFATLFVLSVDPSSTTMISIFLYVWFKALSIASAR
jgi:hypothetical protein